MFPGNPLACGTGLLVWAFLSVNGYHRSVTALAVRPESDRVREACLLMSNDETNVPEPHGSDAAETPIPGETVGESVPETTDEVAAVDDATSDAAVDAHPGTGSTEVVAAGTRHALREKAAKVQTRQARARAARLATIIVLIVAVVAAIAVVVTLVVTRAANQPTVAPPHTVDDGIVVTAAQATFPSGTAGGTLTSPSPSTSESSTATPTPEPSETTSPTPGAHQVEVRVYLDYLSAESGAFEQANAKRLAQLLRDGTITLSYHPVATLASKSNGTKYSLRAAAAAACVAVHSPDAFFAYNHELLTDVPTVDSDGRPDSDLADMAAAAGVTDPQAVRTCIQDGTYIPWVKVVTDRATENKIPGTDDKLTTTPLILVDGVPYVGALNDPSEFTQFVMAAESKAYFQSPSPSPTDSTTPSPSTTASPTN